MNREEFMVAYDRLCRGHRFEATAERAEATYRTIRHWSAHAWEEAVDVLLVDPRMPDRTRLIAAVDAAADRQRRATRPEPYLPERVPAGTANRDYGQTRLDVIKALVRGKLTKRQAGDVLYDLADRFPAHSDDLVSCAAWLANRDAEPAPPLNDSALVPADTPPPQETLVLEPPLHSGQFFTTTTPDGPDAIQEEHDRRLVAGLNLLRAIEAWVVRSVFHVEHPTTEEPQP